MTGPVRCLVITDDLLGGSQLQQAARAAGMTPVGVRRAEDMAQAARQHAPDTVLIDVGRMGLAAVTAAAALEPRPFIVGVGPHVDAALFQAALAAGTDQMLPHSAIQASLVRLLRARTGVGSSPSTGHP